MKKRTNVIGIDVGSVSISAVEMTPEKNIVRKDYEFHSGDIAGRLAAILNRYNLSETRGIAATSSTPSLVNADKFYDNRIAIISQVKQHRPETGSILIVGGEKFGLVMFDENGRYKNYKTNTSCAAGTGSFLDQQARRLNIKGIDEFSRIAYENTGEIPKIASRCAVFAKTDLVHAQQEGYTLPEICDGLCRGLAKNIIDTLFSVDKPLEPILFTGGVSLNKAVVEHIKTMLGQKIIVDDHCVHGAAGAALNLLDEIDKVPQREITSVEDVISEQKKEKKYYHAPLGLERSEYPEFEGVLSYEFTNEDSESPYPVEVDVYRELVQGMEYKGYIGFDIGSTSTKAVFLNASRDVLAGFYTRTAGRPVSAVQNILAAINDLSSRQGITIEITGTGTTGSGRKLVGKIIGADTVIDEITAHARAAYELNPNVDTIIEIGGQDSKFTTLKNGMVTFSVMNNVCAAGTGSFIEELAFRLGCGLKDIAPRTLNRQSPLSSDRCTVFMERDINYYLREGYSVDETLASVLHSIIENYLTKVAIENSIGDFVYFQGATAKNKALVAAFEQRLGKPIHVSKYCHLTGALGTALFLSDNDVKETSFRGIDLYKKAIPIRSEVCELCTNHCKISTADMDGEIVAYGFLCGRDYDVKKRVQNNPSGFDLLKERKRAEAFEKKTEFKEDAVIGLPASLHMVDELPLWKKFFNELGFKTITSEHLADAVKTGKKHAGSEFCAPMIAWYGHVNHLLDKADYVFAPYYLERKSGPKEGRRQYCYYTQFSVPLAADIDNGKSKDKLITPLVHYLYNNFFTRVQLFQSLRKVSRRISFFDVNDAWIKANDYFADYKKRLQAVYARQTTSLDDVHVVFLGRPYTVLSSHMNKGVPEIFAKLGVKAFYQDMIEYSGEDVEKIKPLLDEIHWHYASKILESAEALAKKDGAYPVFITSFKCTPDSFTLEYFKKTMEAHNKPYLILQLDDHDSNVGYETRIEAAVRSFKNHYQSKTLQNTVVYPPALKPERVDKLAGKTLFLPNWDDLILKLMIANLRSVGVDARLLKPNPDSMQKGLQHNTGQCIPLNIIAQEFIDNVKESGVNPADAVLWMANAKLACNIALFPHHIKTILNDYGDGMEKAGVYVGELSFLDVSYKLPFNTYFAILFGGLLRKAGCKIRPYEKVKGSTDDAISKSIDILSDAFYGDRSRESAVDEAVSLFEKIETVPGSKPKVAVFGDLYVRDNEVMNQDLISFIEENGGEVVTTPYTYYMKMIAAPYFRKWLFEGHFRSIISSEACLLTLGRLEKSYYKKFERIIKEPMPEFNESPKKILEEYNMRIENTGESMDNILKIYYLLKEHPDLSLFVQTNPAFCCPSLVTEAMAREIERKTGAPVVSVTYDGTGGNKNDVIVPYLKFAGVEDDGESNRRVKLRAAS